MTEADDNALDAAVNFDTLTIEEVLPDVFGVPDASAGAGDIPELTADKSRRGARRVGRGEKTQEPKPSKDKGPVPNYRAGKYVPALEQMYGYIGMGLMLVDPTCATAVLEASHECAVSIDALGKTNIAVRRVLEALTNTSAIGAVMVAHLPIIMAIAMHHVPAVANIAPMLNMQAAQSAARMAEQEPPTE